MINKTAIKIRRMIWKSISILALILVFLMVSPIIVMAHFIAYSITAGSWLFNNKTFKESWNEGIIGWEETKILPMFKPKFNL